MSAPGAAGWHPALEKIIRAWSQSANEATTLVQQSRYDRLGSTYEMAANSLAALSMRHPAAVMEAIAAWRQGAQARMPSGIDDKQARLALDWLYYDAALRLCRKWDGNEELRKILFNSSGTNKQLLFDSHIVALCRDPSMPDLTVQRGEPRHLMHGVACKYAELLEAVSVQAFSYLVDAFLLCMRMHYLRSDRDRDRPEPLQALCGLMTRVRLPLRTERGLLEVTAFLRALTRDADRNVPFNFPGPDEKRTRAEVQHAMARMLTHVLSQAIGVPLADPDPSTPPDRALSAMRGWLEQVSTLRFGLRAWMTGPKGHKHVPDAAPLHAVVTCLYPGFPDRFLEDSFWLLEHLRACLSRSRLLPEKLATVRALHALVRTFFAQHLPAAGAKTGADFLNRVFRPRSRGEAGEGLNLFDLLRLGELMSTGDDLLRPVRAMLAQALVKLPEAGAALFKSLLALEGPGAVDARRLAVQMLRDACISAGGRRELNGRDGINANLLDVGRDEDMALLAEGALQRLVLGPDVNVLTVVDAVVARQVLGSLASLLDLCLDKLSPTKGLVGGAKIDTSFNPVLRDLMSAIPYVPLASDPAAFERLTELVVHSDPGNPSLEQEMRREAQDMLRRMVVHLPTRRRAVLGFLCRVLLGRVQVVAAGGRRVLGEVLELATTALSLLDLWSASPASASIASEEQVDVTHLESTGLAMLAVPVPAVRAKGLAMLVATRQVVHRLVEGTPGAPPPGLLVADVVDNEGDDVSADVFWRLGEWSDMWQAHRPLPAGGVTFVKLMSAEGGPGSSEQQRWALALSEVVKRASIASQSGFSQLFEHCAAVVRHPPREGPLALAHWRTCAGLCTALLHHSGAGSRDSMQQVVGWLRDAALADADKTKGAAETEAMREAAVWALGSAWPGAAELVLLSLPSTLEVEDKRSMWGRSKRNAARLAHADIVRLLAVSLPPGTVRAQQAVATYLDLFLRSALEILTRPLESLDDELSLRYTVATILRSCAVELVGAAADVPERRAWLMRERHAGLLATMMAWSAQAGSGPAGLVEDGCDARVSTAFQANARLAVPPADEAGLPDQTELRWSYVGVAAQLATAQLMDSGPGGDGSVKAGKAKAGGGDAPAIDMPRCLTWIDQMMATATRMQGTLTTAEAARVPPQGRPHLANTLHAPSPASIARHALQNLLRSRWRDVLPGAVERCYAEEPAIANRYFSVLTETVAAMEVPCEPHVMLPLMLYKLVDPTPSVRDDAVHLWYELIRKFWNDDDPQVDAAEEQSRTVVGTLQESYLRLQYDLSKIIAQHHTDLTEALVLEMLRRQAQSRDLIAQHRFLVCLTPWMENITLPLRWEGAKTLLGEMYSATEARGNHFSHEVERLWKAVGERRDNLGPVLEFVLWKGQESSVDPSRLSAYFGVAKRICLYLSRADKESNRAPETINRLVDEYMYRILRERGVASDAAPVGEALVMPGCERPILAGAVIRRDATLLVPELALCLLSEVAYEATSELLEHVPKLLHIAVVCMDSPSTPVQQHAQQLLLNLVFSVHTRVEGLGDMRSYAKATALIAYLQSANGRRLVPTEAPDLDLYLRGARSASESAIQGLVSLAVESMPPTLNAAAAWASVAMEWVRGCASRHLAFRSLQVLKALRPELSVQMLADLIHCLAAACAVPSRWALALACEIKLIVHEAVMAQEPSKLLLFPQLFWVSMAEMGSVHAHVFHMGAVTCTRLLGILYVSLEKVQNVLLSSMPMQVGSGREALGAIVPSLVRGLACPSTEVQQSALAMCCAFIPPLFSASARQDLFYRCTPHLCAMLVSLCAWMCAAELSGSAPAVAVDTLHRTFGACPDTKLSMSVVPTLVSLVDALESRRQVHERSVSRKGSTSPAHHNRPSSPPSVSSFSRTAARDGAEFQARLRVALEDICSAFLPDPGAELQSASLEGETAGVILSSLHLLLAHGREDIRRGALVTAREGVPVSRWLAGHGQVQGLVEAALAVPVGLQEEALSLLHVLITLTGPSQGDGLRSASETIAWAQGQDLVAQDLHNVLRTFPGSKYVVQDTAMHCIREDRGAPSPPSRDP